MEPMEKNSINEWITGLERKRWLKAVVKETKRPDPNERWANELTGDYHPSFHATKEEAEAAALAFVERCNK